MIDPRGLTAIQWTSQVALTLSTHGPLPVLRDERDWGRWALDAISIPSIATFAPPSPVGFTDWRTWAERFVGCVLL